MAGSERIAVELVSRAARLDGSPNPETLNPTP